MAPKIGSPVYLRAIRLRSWICAVLDARCYEDPLLVHVSCAVNHKCAVLMYRSLDDTLVP